MRGIGPSGVSRTLVLIDDVPFNDPFGGWVYWTRVPLGAVDRIEMVDGSTSSLYGNYAMGGVINIVTSRPGAAHRRTRARSTATGAARSSTSSAATSGGTSGSRSKAASSTPTGILQVAEPERGPIDTNVKVEFRNFNTKVDYNPTSNVSTFVRVGYFSEERDNAKKVIIPDSAARFPRQTTRAGRR